MDQRQQLEQAIRALESQRATLGDAAVDAALEGLRERLSALDQESPTPPSLAGERKLVTVMFADISGFVALVEKMDPEVARDLLNRCFERLVPIIEKYGGTVDKFIGDAVMALFGAPVAHENDPERALRAALEMRDALSAFNAEQCTDFEVHFGINTGLVIAGHLGTRHKQEYSVIGAAVNLAARLEDLSRPGEILVGPDTFRLTAPCFEFEPLEPVHVKGKQEAVQAYRLVSLKAVRGRERGIAGLKSPLVGRQAELSRLREAVCRLEDGTGSIVTLTGEAGLGKSRLAAELRTSIAEPERIHWIEGRCLSYGASIAYLMWIDLLREVLGVTQETDPPTVAHVLQERVAILCPDDVDSVYPYLARLMSLPPEGDLAAALEERTGEDLKRATFHALLTLLERMALRQPLVVVGEDLHWSDPTSLELLEQALTLVERVPLLFVLVFRPQADHGCWNLRETAAQEFASRHVEIVLEPLSADDSAALVESLLELTDLPSQLEARILERAEGNPFYVEELLRSLILDGVLQREEESGMWHVTRPVEEIAIPDTLHGVLVARIDHLQEETKRVLQLASVIGRTFLYRVLAAIAEEESSLDQHIVELQEEEMIRERARMPELEYVFRHHLTQEAAYNGLLKQERRIFHRRVAETLERIFPARGEEHVGLLAHHWERAGVPEKAVRYLLRAGDHARLLYAHREAIDDYRRALAFLKQQGEEEQAARTLMKLGLTHYTAFDFRRARQAYEEGALLWERVGARQPADLPAAPHALRTKLIEPATLDPGRGSDTFSSIVIDQLFNGLLEISPEMELVPLVARSWDITDEGQRYVFHLRDDVVWSDGVPVTAYDFAFAWRRVLSPDFPAPSVDLMYDVKGARAFRRGETTDPHTLGVRALSEGVLEVELEGPCAYFPYLLSFSLFYPVPRHAVEEHGLGWADLDRILTNGPFRIHSWEPGHSIELVRNPDYCGRCEGNVERVELSLLTDWPVILPRYREDELDVLDLWGLAMADVDRARQRHPEEYVTRPAPVTVHVRMNTIRAPLDDRRVRRALSLAVDQESLTNHVLGDFGSPAGGGFVPPGMPGYSPSIGLPYEPDRARRLLAEAGYPEGRGLPKLSMIAPNRPLFVQLGEFLQTRWKEELGIELLWQVMEWAELNPYLKSTPPHLFLVAWEADYFDPHSFLRSGIQSSNLHWRDAVYEQWVEEARRTVDREDRMALYAQVDRRLMEEAVSIPLVYPRHHFLIKPWVRRYPISAIRYWFWKDVILEPH